LKEFNKKIVQYFHFMHIKAYITGERGMIHRWNVLK